MFYLRFREPREGFTCLKWVRNGVGVLFITIDGSTSYHRHSETRGVGSEAEETLFSKKKKNPQGKKWPQSK